MIVSMMAKKLTQLCDFAEASTSSQEQSAESSAQSPELSSTVVQDARQQAAIVLASIAHNHECPLTIRFTDPDFIERLYTVALAPDVSMQVKFLHLPQFIAAADCIADHQAVDHILLKGVLLQADTWP